MRIALATSKDYPALTDDDQLLLQPLARRGIHAEPAVWSDPGCSWNSYNFVVIRSCWDYHLRIAEFRTWIESLESAGVRVWNSPTVIRWNADKDYLRELEAKGVPIVPTLWFERESQISLAHELRNAGWQQAVIKPRISATAHRTKLIRAEKAYDAQGFFDELRAGPGVMVQKFMEAIVHQGEWSLMFFDGKFSHAALKTPKSGDFRVQHDFGGKELPADPPKFLLDSAQKAINVVNDTLYARVDGVVEDGQFYLMELELIEPALFLGSSPSAADRFADAIALRATR